MMTISNIYSKKQFKKAGVVNITLFSLNTIVFLLITPFSLRIMGVELYGLWVILMAILQFGLVGSFGAPSVSGRYIPQYLANNETQKIFSVIAFSFIFMLINGLITSAIIYSISGFLSSQFQLIGITKNEFELSIRWVSLAIVPLFLLQAYKSFLWALIKNELAGGIEFLQQVLLWVGAIVVVLQGYSIVGLGIWGFILYITIFAVLSVIVVKELTKLGKLSLFEFDKSLLKDFFSFSITSWISSIGGLLFQTCDRLLVGYFLGPSSAGVYAIASSVSLRLTNLVGQFAQPLTPFASKHYFSDEIIKIRDLYRSTTKFVWVILISSMAILFIWIDEILIIWISGEFSSQYAVIFKIMIASYSLFSVHRTGHHTLIGIGNVKFPAKILVGGALLTLLSIYLLSVYGLIGIAGANFAYTVTLLLNLRAMNSLGISKKTLWEDWSRILLIGVSVAIISLFSHNIGVDLLLSFIIGAAFIMETNFIEIIFNKRIFT